MELREDVYNMLISQITKRIEELENFYDDNIEDSRVANFEKGRIRLKKLLMYDPDFMNKMELESQNEFRGLTFSYNK